jgi:hypothetical protein
MTARLARTPAATRIECIRLPFVKGRGEELNGSNQSRGIWLNFFVTPEPDLLSSVMMSLVVTKFARATFALAEITIVVTIMAVLAASAVPGFFTRRKQTRSTT